MLGIRFEARIRVTVTATGLRSLLKLALRITLFPISTHWNYNYFIRNFIRSTHVNRTVIVNA